MRLNTLFAVTIGLSTIPTAAAAQPSTPAIVEYDTIAPLTGAEARAEPGIRYRMLFNVTKTAATLDAVNPSFGKVARCSTC